MLGLQNKCLFPQYDQAFLEHRQLSLFISRTRKSFVFDKKIKYIFNTELVINRQSLKTLNVKFDELKPSMNINLIKAISSGMK